METEAKDFKQKIWVYRYGGNDYIFSIYGNTHRVSPHAQARAKERKGKMTNTMISVGLNITNLLFSGSFYTSNSFSSKGDIPFEMHAYAENTIVNVNDYKGSDKWLKKYGVIFSSTNLTVTTKFAPQIRASNDWWIIELKEDNRNAPKKDSRL